MNALNLSSNDVLNIPSRRLSKVESLRSEVYESIENDYSSFLKEGVESEVLMIHGGGWKKGKVKIKVDIAIEFIPDEPTEPEITDIVMGGHRTDL